MIDVKSSKESVGMDPLGWASQYFDARMPQRLELLRIYDEACLILCQMGVAESRSMLAQKFQQVADTMAADIRDQSRQYKGLLHSPSEMKAKLLGSEKFGTSIDYLQSQQSHTFCPAHCSIDLADIESHLNASYRPAMAPEQSNKPLSPLDANRYS